MKKLNKKGLLTVIGGLGLVAGGVVLTKKNVIKAKAIMEEHADNVKTIEECAVQLPEEYSEEDKTRDTFINNVQTAVKMTKTFAIPACVTVIGIYTIVKGVKVCVTKVDEIVELLDIVEEEIVDECQF